MFMQVAGSSKMFYQVHNTQTMFVWPSPIPASTQVVTLIAWRRPRVSLRALSSCRVRATPPCRALSCRTSLSARMPSPAFTLASVALLARTAASRSATACFRRSKPTRPRWAPRSAGSSPRPTTDWTSPPRRTMLPPRPISRATRPRCSRTRPPESKLSHCPRPAVLTEPWVTTARRRRGEHALRLSTAVNPVLCSPVGPPTQSLPGRRLRVTWSVWTRATLPRPRDPRLAQTTTPNPRTCPSPAG